MIRLKMNNYNMILIEKQLKYQLYHQAKYISMKCLTGEDILPPNQQQIIEQAKLTYSLLGKAFEKQIETIEVQGKKQVEVLKTKAINDNNPSISKDIYEKILEERMDEILEMSREINYKNLVYDFKGLTSSISFTKFRGPMYTYDQLKKGDKTLKQVEKEQIDFKTELNEITRGSKKSLTQLSTIKNVKNLYNSRQKTLDLLNNN